MYTFLGRKSIVIIFRVFIGSKKLEEFEKELSKWKNEKYLSSKRRTKIVKKKNEEIKFLIFGSRKNPVCLVRRLEIHVFRNKLWFPHAGSRKVRKKKLKVL